MSLLSPSSKNNGNDGGKRQNLELLYHHDDESATNTPHAGTGTGSTSGSGLGSNGKETQEHTMTWDIFRDIVLAGVEWLIDSESGL